MSNKKIFLDFDETITMSIKAFVDVYKERYKRQIKTGLIKFPVWEKVSTWNMQDEMPQLTIHEINDIFDSERLFDNLAFYSDGIGFSMYDFIEGLLYEYDVDLMIASKGNSKNLMHKRAFITEKLPFFPIDNFIPMEGTVMDKSELQGLMLIDDHESNLYSANVKYKILVNFSGETKEWNARAMHDSEIYKCFTVESLERTVQNLLEFERSR